MDFADAPSEDQLLTVLEVFGLHIPPERDGGPGAPVLLGVLLALTEHLADRSDRTRTEDLADGYFSLAQVLARQEQPDNQEAAQQVWLRLLANRLSRTALELRESAGGPATVVATAAANAAETACTTVTLIHQRKSPAELLAGFDRALVHLDASRSGLEEARSSVTRRQ